MSRYRPDRPDPSLYRPPAGLTRGERAAEQDSAAGGRAARLVTREDGTAVLGSVALRCYRKSRCVYAYLRWSSTTGTAERYIGAVSDCPDRATALRVAWRQARTKTSVPAARRGQPTKRPA